ncbi:MAG: radical SAM protein [Deltaproteobacteria bacterium SG8_13]|nr:MAG: radical SAM protein [Deltaproteobacteria bacterium SG8_13]
MVARSNGEVVELDDYAATGMSGDRVEVLTFDGTCNMPFGSELMMLPDRIPILFHIGRKRFEALAENPQIPGQPVYPVAAFNSPGYVVTGISAYSERSRAGWLPLFSYGAVGWHRGRFRSAVFQVDRERRQDLRLMKRTKVTAGIHEKRKRMPGNRLRLHLERCALTYSCPAGKNFFLGRYEAPLPTSRHCNARCLGCISQQPSGLVPCTQERIGFTPTPEEISEVALTHIQGVTRGVVSFGQGCEGEPLTAFGVIEPAIRRVRAATAKGTIHLNTNGSHPELLDKLFDAGLDSMRVSLNSVQEKYYKAYFRPRGYRFADVLQGIDLALSRGKFVSLNYLHCPGFTDTSGEVKALFRFLREHPIHMIQWRNLNLDPLRYWRTMAKQFPLGAPIGMRRLYSDIRAAFPRLRHGYFNPPKETF